MILSQQSLKSFEEIKGLKDNIKLSNEEFLKLSEVYSEITGKPLSKGCSNCVSTGWKILQNWSDKFYEETLKAYQVKKPKRVRKKKAE